MKTNFTLFAFLLLGIQTAVAQQVVGSVKAPTGDGEIVSIPVVMSSGLGDLARGGNGVVYVDPSVANLPYEFKQMLLAHEAYHALTNSMSETSADCYAANVLRIAGFTPLQMQVVYQGMARHLSLFPDATHPGLQQRLEIVKGCYVRG